MRTDQNLGRDSFRFSESWKKDEAQQLARPSIDERLEGFEVHDDGKVAVHSLSGNERNRLFMNRGGKEFENASTISGLDNPADSRGWVWLDYDRDGWQDIAVVNANAPLVNLYHNKIGSMAGEQEGGMIAVKLEGGGGVGFSCKDGYGAMVEVKLEGMTLKREHRCGEGYSSQNSSTMIIGIGKSREVKAISVSWPSGKTSSLKAVPEGTLVTIYENRSEDEFTQEPYRRVSKPRETPVPKRTFPVSQSNSSKVHVYTTTATWCSACIGHLPALEQLKGEGVSLFGVPVDPNDDAVKLADYVANKKPPYQMLAKIGNAEKESVNAFFAKELHMQNPVLPSSVITDSDGNVLEVVPGIPTISQVRKWARATQ